MEFSVFGRVMSGSPALFRPACLLTEMALFSMSKSDHCSATSSPLRKPLMSSRQVGLDLLRRQDFHFVLQDFGWNAVICRVSEDQALFDRAVERVVQHRVNATDRRVAQPRLFPFCASRSRPCSCRSL